jgi:hypothetical protein
LLLKEKKKKWVKEKKEFKKRTKLQDSLLVIIYREKEMKRIGKIIKR